MLIMNLLRRMRRRKRAQEFLTPADMDRNRVIPQMGDAQAWASC